LQPDGRRLDVQVKGKPRKVPLDISMLQHAVTNLISNAFKFSKERNPEMTIKYQESGASILIRDHGIGIPKEEISNLFQPFHRANNATEISGSGLGLAIAKDYIELNKGSINVESKLNQGTCFTIILPTN
jgi:signal transduction histidine kinase